MCQSNRRFNVPPGKPLAFNAFVVPGGGEFDHYTYEVGNLNSNLDFVQRVPVSKRELINHGGGRHPGGGTPSKTDGDARRKF